MCDHTKFNFFQSELRHLYLRVSMRSDRALIYNIYEN